MNDQEKKKYLEDYHAAKEAGVPFFPDIIFKDVVISLIIFLILAALAYFVGVPMEARADPNDSTYSPRPEWFFQREHYGGILADIGCDIGQGYLFSRPLPADDAARLLTNYPNLGASNVVGNFDGKLAHGGERLALAMPDTIVSTNGGATNRPSPIANEPQANNVPIIGSGW